MAQWLAEEFDAAVTTLDRAANEAQRRFNTRYGDVARVFRQEADIIHFDGEIAAKRSMFIVDASFVSLFIDRCWCVGKPSYSYHLRATLSWETDANDLDLHAQVGGRQQVYYGAKYDSWSNVRLYEDLTQGM
jgi:hypothetical protein